MKKKNLNKEEQGFSLLEAVVSLTLLTVCLAFSLPLFLYARLNNIRSELRTGAVIASQQILDSLRQQNPTTLPTSGNTTVFPAPTSMGHVYNATIYYCENQAYCGSNSRQVRVELKNNGTTIYNIEAVYTQFR
ncbi:MAG: type II secretion system GspH family protein [Aphanothece sp. CMT-3BRIN-NPC111]|jgi:type II secretory pathway pseudopilin PulG|nr:type II secretion system GspH family protein [Aphanothece sp. CMT-3BRIN-NPC111]